MSSVCLSLEDKGAGVRTWRFDSGEIMIYAIDSTGVNSESERFGGTLLSCALALGLWRGPGELSAQKKGTREVVDTNDPKPASGKSGNYYALINSESRRDAQLYVGNTDEKLLVASIFSLIMEHHCAIFYFA